MKKKKSITCKKTLINDKNITQVYNIISSLTDYSNETLNNDIIDMENHIKNNLDNLAKVPIYFSIERLTKIKRNMKNLLIIIFKQINYLIITINMTLVKI